ncbi:hypothetical protein BSL78_29258 [Apostichopus japonicus]|uniref:Integrase catalytic domain-containing protein n=1 Tax=Stichopus japonicus TaxID=307972 RepID=A0A2G8JDW4_STIJA|nr:hypothetical protein BSL78_29258 [Apostichopus japonicus]
MEHFQPPKPLSFEGNIAENWRKWRQRFELYMTATETDKKDENLQCSVLLHLIGEDALEYLTDLRSKANTCEFGTLHDSLIKDRIVCGIQSEPLHERMLRDAKLNLTSAVDMCRAVETSKMHLKTMNSSEHMVMVDKVNTSYGGARRKQFSYNKQRQGQGQSRKTGLNSTNRQHIGSNPNSNIKSCSSCGLDHRREIPASNDETDIFIGALNNHNVATSEQWNVTLKLENKPVTLKVDTGAEANVIPKSLFTRITRHHKVTVTPSKVSLKAYNGQKIPVDGKCTLNCQYKDKNTKLEFIIADVNAQPLLGATTSESLGLIQRIASVEKEHDVSYESLLLDTQEIFTGLGCIPGVHTMEVEGDAKPVIHAPRKIPIALRDKVKQELDRMVSIDVISMVDYPTSWVNSMVVVQKPNGTLRICLDPRDLNQKVTLPTEITAQLSGAKFFSILDASSGFWQVRLDEPSADLCTLNSPFGRYKFKRLPFGLNSAPEVFHRLVHEIFEGLQGVTTYIDDILVWGSSKQEHDLRLIEVLNRAKDRKLTLNKAKCQFGLSKIKYLGHVLTAEGVQIDDGKIEAVVNMPKPQCKKDVERFLGMVTYIAKFIPNLSTVAAPLRQLLCKDVMWHWLENHENAFIQLKKLVTTTPILRYYDVSKPVTLSVDASQSGLGAVLLQDDKPVAYASQALTETQKAYAQIEKEMLAVVHGCERFHQYVYGKQVEIESDHKPLESIVRKPLALVPPRLQRFLLRLQKYDVVIKYRPGKELLIADTLSRAYLNQTGDDKLCEETEAFVHMLTANLPMTDQKLLEFQNATKEVVCLQNLLKLVQSGWPENRSEVIANVRSYWEYQGELHYADGLLFRGERLIVPQSLRKQMLSKIHEGHLGVIKCKSRARETLFWPGMSAQIEDVISKCDICQTYQNSNQKEPLKSHKLPLRPWQKVGMDLFHFHTHEYLLIVDYFSRYVEVCMLKHSTTSSSVIVHIKSVFARHGVPDEVMSDNGPKFHCKEFTEFAKQWGFMPFDSSHSRTAWPKDRYKQSRGCSRKLWPKGGILTIVF